MFSTSERIGFGYWRKKTLGSSLGTDRVRVLALHFIPIWYYQVFFDYIHDKVFFWFNLGPRGLSWTYQTIKQGAAKKKSKHCIFKFWNLCLIGTTNVLAFCLLSLLEHYQCFPSEDVCLIFVLGEYFPIHPKGAGNVLDNMISEDHVIQYHPCCQWISRHTSLQCGEYWQCQNQYNNDERMVNIQTSAHGFM